MFIGTLARWKEDKKYGSSGVFVGKAKQPSFHSENDG